MVGGTMTSTISFAGVYGKIHFKDTTGQHYSASLRLKNADSFAITEDPYGHLTINASSKNQPIYSRTYTDPRFVENIILDKVDKGTNVVTNIIRCDLFSKLSPIKIREIYDSVLTTQANSCVKVDQAERSVFSLKDASSVDVDDSTACQYRAEDVSRLKIDKSVEDQIDFSASVPQERHYIPNLFVNRLDLGRKGDFRQSGSSYSLLEEVKVDKDNKEGQVTLNNSAKSDITMLGEDVQLVQTDRAVSTIYSVFSKALITLMNTDKKRLSCKIHCMFDDSIARLSNNATIFVDENCGKIIQSCDSQSGIHRNAGFIGLLDKAISRISLLTGVMQQKDFSQAFIKNHAGILFKEGYSFTEIKHLSPLWYEQEMLPEEESSGAIIQKDRSVTQIEETEGSSLVFGEPETKVLFSSVPPLSVKLYPLKCSFSIEVDGKSSRISEEDEGIMPSFVAKQYYAYLEKIIDGYKQL